MARLGELCTIQSGGTPSRGNMSYWKNGTVPWVKISDIHGKYLNEVEEYITEEGLANSSAKIFPCGTILYTIFATLGDVCVLNIDAATNQAIVGIQIKSDLIDADYLYYYLSSLKNKVNDIGRGVAQNNINMTMLRDFEIPLPPLDEQRKIAAVLDKINELTAKRRRQLDKLDELVKSRFVEMFGDPLLNTKGWAQVAIKDVCVSILGGGTPSKSHPEYFTGTIPWVSPKDVKTSIIDDSIDHITEDALANSTTNLVPQNSVLMVVRSGILKHTLPVAINSVPVAINQDMKAFIIPNDRITAEYFMYYLKSIEQDILGNVRCVTADNIDFKAFQKRQISLPPLKLQQQFTSFLNCSNTFRFLAYNSLKKLELLKYAVVQKYFETR